LDENFVVSIFIIYLCIEFTKNSQKNDRKVDENADSGRQKLATGNARKSPSGTQKNPAQQSIQATYRCPG
jgi:ABC-type molybdate transport system substrate-binding protein